MAVDGRASRSDAEQAASAQVEAAPVADDGTSIELPASLAAAWGLRERSTKGPKRGLSLERIVMAAVQLAATEGLAAVSMSRVAKELGAATMSLYRYVAAKDELLTLMVDVATGLPPRPAPDEDWRAGLTRWAWAYRVRLREHPWMLRVRISAPPNTPNQLCWLEDALRSLAGTRISPADKLSVVLLVSGYVRNDSALMADILASALASGSTLDQVMLDYGRSLRVLATQERFPEVHAVLASGVLDRADEPDDEFIFGLDRVLDGIEVLVRSPHEARRSLG